MKKIFVGKNETIAEVVGKVIGAEGVEIVLMIPKNAALGTSVANFNLLKRESDAAGKKIAIESVDENILALAKAAELASAHPLFEAGGNNFSLSDIVPAKAARGVMRPLPVQKNRKGIKKGEDKESPREKPAEISPWTPPRATEEQVEKKAMPVAETRPKVEMRSAPEIRYEAERELPEPSFLRRRWKLIFWSLASIGVLIGIIWVLNSFFSNVTVTINFKKTPWTYEHTVLADTAISKINFEKNILPAELFTANKNLTKLFPATGRSQVSEKASGKITIYNAYSSKLQALVASTRFVTPEGKIFRLISGAVVPGAQITSGKIEPASIEAGVVADQAGPDYNVGPVGKLTIPGLKGSPKYAGFYGELKDGAKGGFVGQKAVPTADDVLKAKNKAAEILKTTLESNLLTLYPQDFKNLSGTTSFNVSKLNVNENTDASGNFSVFAEANIAALGFREADLKSFLGTLAAKDNPEIVFSELNLTYSQVQADFKNKTESFALSAQGVLTQKFSADDFRGKILGKKVAEVRTLISALPGLADARISIWPTWLGHVPVDPKKVKIVVN